MTASSSGWPGQTKAARGWTLRGDQGLLEGDALVARQHRFADADQAVAVAHGGGDVGDLVTPGLALLGRAAESFEGLKEEGLDVVRLQTTGIGALHVLADALHAAGIHGIVGQDTLFEQDPAGDRGRVPYRARW
jgi:hypothetical protein